MSTNETHLIWYAASFIQESSTLLSSFLSVFFQSLYGMQHLSTRSLPTSTSPPYRLSSPLTSPSTSRLALLQECFWRTWASRTSSEWSSAVSQRSEQNKRSAARTKYTTSSCTQNAKKEQPYIRTPTKAVSGFLAFLEWKC